MTLIETLATTMGYAIAKSLREVWLGDGPALKTASGTLLDSLKSKTDNALAARRGARTFEELGDKIALNLEPVFKAYDVNPSSSKAIAEEVATAIEVSEISAKLLAELNHDPARVQQYIESCHPTGDQLFNEKETALYSRCIDLTAQYIVDLAPTLPNYTSRNFTEVLQRFDLSISKLDEILEELDQLRTVSEEGNVQRAAAEFERDYRANIIREFDKVNLFGADVSRGAKRYRLTVSYISLDVTREAAPIWNHKDENRVSIPKALSNINLSRSELEPANRSTKAAIIGEAGSGKTTLLHWLAVKCSAGSFEKELATWNNLVPFVIELRRYPDGPPPPEDFLKNATPIIAGSMPDLWVHDILKNGRGLLLVDGLDEVAPSKRGEVRDWLASIAQTYVNTHIIFTSRPAAYEPSWLDFLGFQDFHLAAMQMIDIERFVRYWHRAVLKENMLESEKAIEIIVAKLLKKLRNSNPLLRLATNPLLCAMICALHYDRNMQLPSDRNDLYEACCTMLLHRRDEEREVHIDQYPALTYKQKRVLVEDLAYWMMKNDYSAAHKRDVVYRLNLRLKNMIPGSKVDGEHVLPLLTERTGMLRQLSAENLDFVHRTFQEYLAASAASSEGDWGLLLKNATNDQWQETIILAAGFANQQQADALIKGLLDLSEEDSTSYFDILAISCLETAVEISPNIRRLVEEKVSRLIPPTNKEQWKPLAAAGDIAVPKLELRDTFSAEEAAACVQVLGLIGTQKALAALGPYSLDERPLVTSSLDATLSSFTPKDVVSSGLARALIQSFHIFKEENTLTLTGHKSHALSELTTSEIIKQVPFAHKTILDLQILQCQKDAHIVSVFPYINRLMISGDLPSTLSFLAQTEVLKELDLRNHSDVWPSLGNLHRLKKLRFLSLTSDSDIWPDFSELMNSGSLERLSVYAKLSVDLPDTSDFTSLQTLNYVEIGFSRGTWPDLSPLCQLENLNCIEISTESHDIPEGIFGVENLSHIDSIIINVDSVSRAILRFKDELELLLPQCNVRIREGWIPDRW